LIIYTTNAIYQGCFSIIAKQFFAKIFCGVVTIFQIKPTNMTKFSSSFRFIGMLVFFLCLGAVGIAQSVIKGTIKDSTMPLEGASIIVEGQDVGTRSASNGSFELKLRAGSHTLIVSYIGYASQRKTVTLASGQTITVNFMLQKDRSSQAVTVVGSRSTTFRSNTQTAAPVDVFTTKELSLTGQIEPAQMINFVAPSFNSSRQTIADGTDHIDPATLRGLGPDQVLVLIDGKRRHNTALLNVNTTIGRGSVGTDLNSIPVSAIEKIEVLRDGASSQYGSDAIAGVINIVLKKDYKKTNVNLHAGQQYAGDGRVLGFALNQGWKLGKKGYFDFFADVRSREATNRAGDFTGTVYYNATGTQAQRDSIIKLDNQVIKERGFSRKNNLRVGNSAVDNYGFMINTGAPLSERVNFTLNAGTNYREGEAAGMYRYPKQTSQVIAAIYPDGFLPIIRSTIRDNNISGGLDGVMKNGWRWDLSNTYGANSFLFEVENSNNASQYALGKDAQTEFYAGKLRFGQNTSNLNLAKDIGNRIGLKTFNIGIGGEFRIENYQILPGEPNSYLNLDPASGRAAGAQVFPGFNPANAVNETRYIGGGYVDIETDITDKLLLNAAGRYENYSDFGGNVAGKLSARYKVANAFTLRGTISNGFRAPSMHQRFFSTVSTLFISNGTSLVPVQQGTFRNNSEVAKAFGIPSLTAEKSTNYSVGFTSRPFSNVSITVDAYQIEIKDRIVISGSFPKSNPAIAALLAGFPDVTSAAFFSNAISTRTRGLDVVANGSYTLGKGTLDVTLAGNFNNTKVIGDVKTSAKLPADSFNTNTLFDRAQRAIIEEGQPKNKVMLNLNYRVGKLNFMLRNTRFGDVATKDRVNPALDETFGAKIVTDASISVRPVQWLNITLGANNIADVYPDPLMKVGNQNEGRFIYSRASTQFGFNGGYYYTNLAFDLTDLKKKKKVTPVAYTPPAPVVRAPDRDNDSVPDSKDVCPDAAGPASLQGCPDKDGDGIADKDDKCPEVAGMRMFGGCPDSDFDGVEDAKDKCPTVFGSPQYDGCRVPDTDGDGLNDAYDACPTVPGLIANNGCPEKKEVREEIQQQVDKKAKFIFFISGSATLASSSNGALNDIASTLKDNAELQVEIEGHTDNTGSAETNQKLSEDRANAVKTSLVSKGVSADRVTTTGYGFSKPVAPNITAEGRAKNRRVVILIK
jgi:iron complex outermembrane recepter protein